MRDRSAFVTSCLGLFLATLAACSGSNFPVAKDPVASNPVDTTTPQTPTPTPTPTPTVTCPTNYVLVPADTTLGNSAFCLAKYEMKLKTNAGTEVFDGYNGGVALDVTQYVPDSRPDGIPWVRITQANAILECANLGSGYHLVTVKEWAAMARNVESVGANWISGIVGTGTMYKGHSDNVASATAIADGFGATGTTMLGSGNGSDPYAGTGNSAGDAIGSGKEQRRTSTLTNGEVIWDVAGNARDFNDVDGLGSTISYTGAGASGTHEVFSTEATNFIASIVISAGGTFAANWLLPVTAGVTDPVNYVGKLYIQSNARSGKIITRGANFNVTNRPGVFSADFDSDNATTSSSAGIRCAKNP